MRGSTAAGINVSLLPRDCSCEEFACSAVWEETFPLAFVGNLPMVLYWKRLLFLVFVGFPVALSGGRLLFPDICGIWHIRYRRGSPGVRNMRAVRRTAICGTRRIFRSARCAEAPSVFLRAQLNQLMAWKQDNKRLGCDQVKIVKDYIHKRMFQDYSLNHAGDFQLEKHIRNYGLVSVLDKVDETYLVLPQFS